MTTLFIACGGGYETQDLPFFTDAGVDTGVFSNLDASNDVSSPIDSGHDADISEPPPSDAGADATDAGVIVDGSSDAGTTPEAGTGPGDTTPLPSTCAPTKVPCTAISCSSACFSVAHVANPGPLVMAKGLTATTIASKGGVVGNTATGALGGRRANTDPTAYEIWDGIGFQLVTQAGSTTPLAVWTFLSLDIQGGTLSFSGTSPVVLLARTSLTVASSAVIDVSANNLTPGPGGSIGGTYRAAGQGCGAGQPPAGTTTSAEGGGGGGGFGAKGGAGGGGSGAGGTAGGACNPSYLTGGSGGAGGDDSGATGRFGGAGGGAIQLSSANAITILGTIVASGGGGRTAIGNFRNGAGAGSGGMIYIEGVETTAATTGLFANGGGGGSASAGTGNTCAGALASNGAASTTAALGSHCAHGWGGNGGATGGTLTGAVGESGTAGGGGGGGVGRVVIASARGASATPQGTESPAAALLSMTP